MVQFQIVAMQHKAAAPEFLRSGQRRQPSHQRPLDGIGIEMTYCVISPRNWAYIGIIFQRWVIEADAVAGIAGADQLPVVAQVSITAVVRPDAMPPDRQQPSLLNLCDPARILVHSCSRDIEFP